MAKGFKLKLWHIVVIVLILAIYFNYIQLPTIVPQQVAQPTPTVTVAPEVIYEATSIKWSIVNIITSADSGAASTSYVDISVLKNGIFDPLSTSESTEYDASPDTSTLAYNYGDELVLHVSSDKDATGGEEMYDRWFYVKLVPGEPIRELTLSALQPVQFSPTYKYSINKFACPETGDVVQYLGGDTPYWGLGALKLYPRVAKDYITATVSWAGTVMTSITDGASWDDTQAEQDADVTLTTDNEDFYLNLIGDGTDVCYALPQLVIMGNGEIKEYRSVAVIATNATAIGVSALTAEGWMPINKVGLTGAMAFYKVLDPIVPTRGSKFSKSIRIPIDASGLSNSVAFDIMVWILDIQSPSNVAIGTTTTSLPTKYGIISDFGCDTIILGRALTVSGGAAATPQLYGDWTTS